MTRRSELSRRQLGLGLAAGAAVGAGPLGFATPALAQVPADPWQALAQISADARKLGLSVPQITSSGAGGGAAYREIFPALVDFIDKLDDAAAKSNAPKAELEKLQNRAADLLQAIHNKERSPRQKKSEFAPEFAPGPRSWLSMLVTPAHAQTHIDPRFKEWHDSYLKLFDTCVVRPEFRRDVDQIVQTITSDKFRAHYETVANAVCVPWYFIGVVHSLEASLNFRGHLHNGDSLSRRTVNEPSGLPKEWLPPSDWESSARDALEHEKFTDEMDWSLAHTLFRLEIYNGVGSRGRGIHTPYLWSFSNQYTRGKYVADNEWDSSAVSQQCGAAVLLKEMVDKGTVAFTA